MFNLAQRLAQICPTRSAHIALHDTQGPVTYGALWQRINRVSHRLAALIEPGEHVALLLDNSADYAAAVYGAWQAGAVVVLLNTSLKAEDLLGQIAHSQARVLVVDAKQTGLSHAASAAGVQVVNIQTLTATDAHDDDAITHAALTDAAVIIYTSGTTGQAKGVVLTHGNLAHNVAAIQQSLPIHQDDITLCLLPFFYAYGFSVLHTHLTAGATLVLENSLMYPQKVLQHMASLGVTALYGVPSTYYVLLERGHLQRTPLDKLRYCAQAGGAMDPARIDLFCATLPSVDFYVMYGQTEACSRLTVLPSEARTRKTGSVGLPLQSVRLSIQDAQGQALPSGQVGEVCAQGPNVMQGYWQASEDTAQTLKRGWLLTGDLGYLDADGYLFLTGRSREMIKTGAHRVSPWEIEQVINAVPGVTESAVIGVVDHLLGEVVYACVLSPLPENSLRRAIQQACSTQLASYKVPKHVVFCDTFPRTASGKVQKHLLQLSRLNKKDEGPHAN